MNTDTTSSTTSDQAPVKARSIKSHQPYTQALSDLMDRGIESSRVANEDSPEYDAAEQALNAAWDALAAVVDAWAARQ